MKDLNHNQTMDLLHDNGFILNMRGKDFVLYKGLLWLAHAKGLQSIETEMVSIDMDRGLVIHKAIITMKDGRVFHGYGDASNKSVSKNIAPHLLRMSETRAKARALRDAVNIGLCSVEELGGG